MTLFKTVFFIALFLSILFSMAFLVILAALAFWAVEFLPADWLWMSLVGLSIFLVGALAGVIGTVYWGSFVDW